MCFSFARIIYKHSILNVNLPPEVTVTGGSSEGEIAVAVDVDCKHVVSGISLKFSAPFLTFNLTNDVFWRPPLKVNLLTFGSFFVKTKRFILKKI